MANPPQTATLHDGQTIEVDIMEVVSAAEPWTEVLLADGAVLRIKTVLTRVMRPIHAEDMARAGPYIFRHQFVVDIRPAEQEARHG